MVRASLRYYGAPGSKLRRKAGDACPSIKKKRASPHTLRHTTAMHLVQSGVDITLIAMWLGHESIETTHLYITTNLELKENALW